MKSFGQKKIKFHARIKKCHFGIFSDRALVRPSRIPHRVSKILFVYGSYGFLAMLEGKIRQTPFLRFNLVKKQCEQA